VVRRFEKAGLLNLPGTILAHCLHLSAEERKILSQSTAFIAQNCESNLNNRVGFFTAEGLNSNIIIGTDGMHSDILRSSQASYFAGLNHEPMDVSVSYERLFKVHDYLSLHDFDGDSPNNLVVFDYDSPTPLTAENFLGHLYYGLSTDKVQHVISDGRLIVCDRKPTMVDEAEIMLEAREMAKRLWKKL
jgi:cytosine/adenosine deaminase-related metal-dependent hydrolase